MSKEGVKLAAEVFSYMQEIRIALINLGSKDPTTKSGKQDIFLGQMLDHAKDAIKEEFCKITMMNIEET